MDDDLPKRLQNWGGRIRSSERKNKILVLLTLMLSMGLFFYSFSQKSALAVEKNQIIEISAEMIDPLSRLRKGIMMENEKEKDVPILDTAEKEEISPLEESISELVAGYPIQEMAKAISKQDKLVASFLVAIAKKESAWGKHTPKKNGERCYNFWGYRGGENPTQSGYSCFDSPEQAVAVVGARIQRLVNQGIDTPEKMLVWKCGSSCATHDPAGVRKWVSDVAMYINKI